MLTAAWLLTVVQAFAIKGIIERHIADRPPKARCKSRFSCACRGRRRFFGPYYLHTRDQHGGPDRYSSELIDQIEEAEAHQFSATLIARTPSVLVTPAFIALNVLMFLLVAAAGKNLSPAPDVVARWGGDFGPLTTHGQWWRLLTAAFLHFGLTHC